MIKLHEDWTEFLKLLNDHRARFVIVGGHALAANGRPRLTADMDVLVEPTLANARRVAKAVAAFGFEGLAPERLTHPETVVFLGREPFRIDLITSIDGVDFATAWKGRIKGKLGGQPVSFLGREQLIANKRAAGRPKDLADLALLSEIAAVPVRAPRAGPASPRRRRPPRRGTRRS